MPANRIRVSGWVVKESKGAWCLEIGFVDGQIFIPGYTGWISKSQCEVEHRAGDLVHLSVPIWFHVKHRFPKNRKG